MTDLLKMTSTVSVLLKEVGSPLEQDCYERELRIGILCAKLAMLGAEFEVVGKEMTIFLGGVRGEGSISVFFAITSWGQNASQKLLQANEALRAGA